MDDRPNLDALEHEVLRLCDGAHIDSMVTLDVICYAQALEAVLVKIGLMVCGDSDGRWIPRSGRVADVLEPLGLLPSHLTRDPSSGT